MSSQSLNITMIGTGYVGLVSGTCLADIGHNVTCMDVDAEKIRRLSENGEIPIYEPGLENLVRRNVNAGRLSFTTDLATCVPQSDAVFIAVGTPQDEDGSADMKYVLQAAQDIAQHLSGYTVIVDKSTVPVGTGQRVKEIVKQTNPTADFDVASNPEFLREGQAIGDFAKPDRIIVGRETDKCSSIMRAIYKPQTDQGYTLLECNIETAELIKYAANSFLATKISFINEMAILCEKIGADVSKVSVGLGLDSRIGSRFLQVGPGYGGSCFPKDTHALAFQGQQHSCPIDIVESTIRANQRIKKRMSGKISEALGGDLTGKTVAVLGVAFKADTDDMRDAPSLTILPDLVKAGAIVKAYDPAAMENAARLMPQLNYCSSIWDALESADVAVILTEWDEFKTMNLNKVKEALSQPILVDLRNLFMPYAVTDRGLIYHSIGRQTAYPDTAKTEQSVAV